MAYLKLSEQVAKLANPQRSDAFMKHFREAVRLGEIDAVVLQERFKLPKQFRNRSSDETYTRSARDMIFESTPAFDAWFEEANQKFAANRANGKVKSTLENFNAGLVDFKTLAEKTRQSLTASHAKGQKLGHSRFGQKSGRVGSAKTTQKTTKTK